MPYLLTGETNGHIVQHELKNGENRIGRGPDNEIVLNDSAVSRYHAIVVVQKDRLSIKDLNSSNGTFVNGHKIDTQTEMCGGDKIRFGELEFLLSSTDISFLDVSITQVIYFNPEEISTTDSINIEDAAEEVSDQFCRTPILDQQIFQAVTDAGKLLVGSIPIDKIFEQVLDIVERVIPARRILLLMGNSVNETPEVRASRSSKQPANEKLMLSKTIIDTVFRDRKALLLTDALNDPRFQMQESIILQNLHSAMVAPLFDNEDVIGLLYADSDNRSFQYDRYQLGAFTLLANLIAVKITNARLLDAQREKERMEREMEIATQVQQSQLFPIPSVPGYEILAWQISCLNVCGDLYDVEILHDGRVSIVLGDVTGKGMPAALLMSNVLASLRMLYQECPPLNILAERLNKQLLLSSDDMYFVTLFVGFLDPASGDLEYVNAGHNPPLVLHKDGKTVELGSTGLPIGLLDEEVKYKTHKVQLMEDSLLSVYSDGITETMNMENQFGEDRFIHCLKRLFYSPLEEIRDGLYYDLNAFRQDFPFDDDVTLLLLRRKKES